MVSKYFKSSDIDRVKARLLGTSRGNAAKGKKGAPAEKQVIINQHRFQEPVRAKGGRKVSTGA